MSITAVIGRVAPRSNERRSKPCINKLTQRRRTQWKMTTFLLLDCRIRQHKPADYWACPLNNYLNLKSSRILPAINARAAPHTAKHGILTISFIRRLYIILPKDGDGFITGYLLGLNIADIRTIQETTTLSQRQWLHSFNWLRPKIYCAKLTEAY